MNRLILIFLLVLSASDHASAMPAFARTYQMSCQGCHSAFPKLNSGGETFRDNNFRFPNWQSAEIATIQDDELKLAKFPPIAFRMQAFMQVRDKGEIFDQESGQKVAESAFDFQSPYLVKMLSSAPLTENLTYYFYAILAEKGRNGSILLEDAWFQYADLFDSGISMQLGQFQISDVMFPREIRLTFQDYMIYRMASLTYERGVLFGGALGPVDINLGIVNGNGIEQNSGLTSQGIARSDRIFDQDNDKSVFTHLGSELAGTNLGLFALGGRHYSHSGPRLSETSPRELSDKRIYGLDIARQLSEKLDIFLQIIHNEWDEFNLNDLQKKYSWSGGFLGADYTMSPRWAFSFLHNYVDAGDFVDTDTLYRGLAMNTTTLGASHYVARNAKIVFEATYDWLERDSKTIDKTYGHQTTEHAFVFGFDAAM